MKKCKHIQRKVTKHYLCCASCKKKLRKIAMWEQELLFKLGLKDRKDLPDSIPATDIQYMMEHNQFMPIRAQIAINKATQLLETTS